MKILNVKKRRFCNVKHLSILQIFLLTVEGFRISKAEMPRTWQRVRNYSILNRAALTRNCSALAQVHIPCIFFGESFKDVMH